MIRTLLLLYVLPVATVGAFVPFQTKSHCRPFLLNGANKHGDGEKNTDYYVEKKAFVEGTLVEFSEKKRTHIGKILSIERKANGGARYDVEDHKTGKHYSIADKEVQFSIPAPTNENVAEKLLERMDHAQEISEKEVIEELDMPIELLEMAWEEVAMDEDSDNVLTPDSLVEMVHSHKPDHIEKYKAWRLLKSEIGHVYFKELKENSRVVAFKAKAPSAVEASKETYVNTHDDNLLDLAP